MKQQTTFEKVIIFYAIYYAITTAINLKSDLAFFLPEDLRLMAGNPKTLTWTQIKIINALLSFVPPVLGGIFFSIKISKGEYYLSKAAKYFLSAGMAASFLFWGLLYASTFIQGGGATFALKYYIHPFMFPIKVINHIGVAYFLLNLKVSPNKSLKDAP